METLRIAQHLTSADVNLCLLQRFQLSCVVSFSKFAVISSVSNSVVELRNSRDKRGKVSMLYVRNSDVLLTTTKNPLEVFFEGNFKLTTNKGN